MNYRLTKLEREMIKTLYNAIEAEERLCPSGSGAATGCAGREADKQLGAAEGRSRESGAVAPGEAKALADKWKKQATALIDQKAFFVGKGYSSSLIQLWETVAGVLTDCADELNGVLSEAPKPDSEVSDSERSGRRNAPVDLPDTAAQDSASKSNSPAVSG